MKRFGGFVFLIAAFATAAGCSPYNVDVSLEGINWYVVHPRLYCFDYPYANPHCPYYDYRQDEWCPAGPERSPVSAVYAPDVVPKLEEKTY